MFDFVQSL